MCSIIQFYSWDTCGCGIPEPNPVLERIGKDFEAAMRMKPNRKTPNKMAMLSIKDEEEDL